MSERIISRMAAGVEEAWTGAPNNWRTDFAFDYENRLTQVQGSTVVGGNVVTWNSVSHSYDGLGRRLKTTAGGVNYAHIYDGMKLAGNRNLGTSTDGTAWVNAVNDARPLASLSIATTGATRYYSVSDERDPVRRTYTSGGTAGDTSQQSHYGEYKLINGAAPVFTFFGPRGTKQSEVFPVRSLTVTENDVALPAERGNLEYAGLALVYEGNRVKSALLGRDLNPMGRGDGLYYFAGQMMLPAAIENVRCCDLTQGSGNSVNNGDQYTVTDLDRDFLRCLQDLYEICAACVALMKDIQDPCKRFRSCCENGHWYPPNWNANQKCDCIKEVVDAAQWNNCCRKDKPFWVPYFCRVARGGCKQLSTKQAGETECEQECDDAMNSLCCRAAAALGGNIEECRWLCFDDCENSGLGNAKDEAVSCCKRKYAEQFAHVGGHCLIECMS